MTLLKVDKITMEILLLTILQEICTCAGDTTWAQIYRAMSRNDNRSMNLKSTCPWTFQNANTIQLVYSHGRCLDLNNITPENPAFSAYGRCQPIYPPFSCYSRTAVGYTCIQSSRVQLAMGKRDEDRVLDPPFRCPPEVNVTATDNGGGEEIKPIVGNVELELTEPTIPPPRQTVTIKEGHRNTPLFIKPGAINLKPDNTHHHASSFGLLFPSYLSNHNAQLRPQFPPRQPLLQRPYGGPLTGGQQPLQRPHAGVLGQRLQISNNGINRT